MCGSWNPALRQGVLPQRAANALKRSRDRFWGVNAVATFTCCEFTCGTTSLGRRKGPLPFPCGPSGRPHSTFCALARRPTGPPFNKGRKALSGAGSGMLRCKRGPVTKGSFIDTELRRLGRGPNAGVSLWP